MKNLVIHIFVQLLLVGSTVVAQEGRGRSPNVVFFLVDDLGWRDVGCYGSGFYETPNIDRLANDGVRFTQAYAACHVCSPTRASILTGKYPARLKITDWLPGRKDYRFQKLKNASILQQLPFEEVTLAETLKGHGYRTAIFGKWHLGEEPSGALAHGFDLQVPRWNKGWPRTGYHAPFRMDGLSDSGGDYLTDRLTDEALGFIESNQDQPFFLYLSHFAVHDPIHGRPDLVEKYREKLAMQSDVEGSEFILEGNPDDADPLTREELDALIREKEFEEYRILPRRTVKIKQRQDNIEFAAMVESMDESLGRVRAKLDSLGLTENTIVIFFSDNGGMSAANFGNPRRVVDPSNFDAAYSTSNLPLRGAKGWLYEGGIRVPMIVHWPGRGHEGTVVGEPVISSDFYPSILEMTGLEFMPQQHVDGVSFVPALQGKAFRRGAIYWHFPHYSNHGAQSPGGAIRFGNYKLLDYFENGSVQLFDLKNDPGEQRDLSAKLPQKAGELLALLERWRDSVSANRMESKSDVE